MNYIPKMSRRSFVVTAAAAGGGLALGLDIPLGGPHVIRAEDGSPEINAWVVIKPDDTVVIRVARSEMGQGTLTGLCQLVAEEQWCCWIGCRRSISGSAESAAIRAVSAMQAR